MVAQTTPPPARARQKTSGGRPARAPKDPQRLILAALQAAQADADQVAREGINVGGGYVYARAEDMIRGAKEVLARHKLAVFPVATRTERHPAAHGVGVETYLVRTWTLVHLTHGTLSLGDHAWPVVPETGRPFDKAWAAADTSSLAYFLRNLLQLPRTEAGTGLDDSNRPTTGAPVPSVKLSLMNAVTVEFDRHVVAVERRAAVSVHLIGHKPTSIEDLQNLIAALRGLKPGALALAEETGHPND